MRLVPIFLLLPGCVWISDDDLADRTAAITDRDGDGYQDATWGGDDCDDANASVHPGAEETCNGVDDDCDGTEDDGLLTPWYADTDGDGFGDAAAMTLACVAPSGSVADATDCDDGDAAVNADAEETCNGVDDDCDGETDEDDAVDAATWYTDGDGDGYGEGAVQACAQPSGTVAEGGDCDDANAEVHPGATETCNGVDDDCDEDVDEPGASGGATWHRDADGDGYGDPTDSLQACTQPSGYVASDLATDCDDGAADIHPGALEILADSDDGDCDGGDDTFPFALVDTRSAQDVEGPRLAQGGGNVYLGWAAEEQNDGTRTYDVVAVLLLDDLAPWDGEVDFWSAGQSTNLAILGQFDLAANATNWVTASSWLDTTYRTILLDGVNAGTRTHGTYRSRTTWTVGFDQVQAAISTSNNVTAIGCGLSSAGMQAVQYNVTNLTAGVGSPNADSVIHSTSDDHDVCEYDHSAAQFFAFDSLDRHLDYYVLSGGTLTPTSSSTGSWVVNDLEISTDNGYLVIALADVEAGNGFYFQIAPMGGGSSVYDWSFTASAVVALDTSAAPSDLAYACGVDATGHAYLLWSDLLGVPSPALNIVGLTASDLSTVDDCAITITADSVAVIALRGGDDIAFATVQVP